MEDVNQVITLVDDNGNEIDFFFLDVIEYDGKEYAALIPVDESEDGDEVTILEAKRNADGEFDDMIGISDEAVLNAVFELFIKNYNEDED
ncbi:MAG: DUF1292 domain-containing protein [Eubacteriales bacterium]|nr:DUF1292 domain-containing protein [Eubacteriales bacterium]MCI7570028.1 DUF1292 domain-containing protein [Clostridiales bacterium]MDD7551304.1 DUF1292 domain-containing protein [Clostridia bacterium]MDY5754633.1 DUF1292 domain-containing protein [Eubacteriales bacterium]